LKQLHWLNKTDFLQYELNSYIKNNAMHSTHSNDMCFDLEFFPSQLLLRDDCNLNKKLVILLLATCWSRRTWNVGCCSLLGRLKLHN